MYPVYFNFQAWATLADHTDREDSIVSIGAVMGLGLAYAGSRNKKVRILILFQIIWVPYAIIGAMR